MPAVPSLSELQHDFLAQVLAPDGDLPGLIRPNGLTSAARLGVYRNNTFTGLGKHLRAVYPVVERLVGEPFFRYAAREYIRRYPSHSGDIGDYGTELPDFLAQFEPTRALSYLPDVARLELARHRAWRAADHDPLDLAALGRVAPEDYETLRFTLHPSVRLLESRYPVLRIWQVNQPDFAGDQTVDLNAGSCRLLVCRSGLDVRQQSLTNGEFVLLQTLVTGLDFGSACECALEADPDCNLGATLQRLVAGGMVVGFST